MIIIIIIIIIIITRITPEWNCGCHYARGSEIYYSSAGFISLNRHHAIEADRALFYQDIPSYCALHEQ